MAPDSILMVTTAVYIRPCTLVELTQNGFFTFDPTAERYFVGETVVLLERSWLWRYYRRFNIKTGTTIIGMAEVILHILNLLEAWLFGNDQYIKFDTAAETVKKSIWWILTIIGIIIGSLLLHGNSKNITRIMRPALYWWFGWIVLKTVTVVMSIVQSPRAFPGFQSQWFAGLMGSLIVFWLLNLSYIQIVRCRIANIEEMKTGQAFVTPYDTCDTQTLKCNQEFDLPKAL